MIRDGLVDLCARRRVGVRDPAADGGRVRADDGAHEEPRSRDGVAALRRRVATGSCSRRAHARWSWSRSLAPGIAGRTIYGEVAGYGASDDAFHITAPDPKGTGAAIAIRRALEDAGEEPPAVQYVNAHGTSTQLNDAGETAALKAALGDEVAHRVAVSSTKSMTGHMLGAAGAVEAAASILAIQRGTIPPTIHYETPDPDCDLDYVPNEARKADLTFAISNSFGFGGQNAVVAFRKAT